MSSFQNFRVNVVASYIGSLYTALIGIFMVPIYIRHLGAETYGLVGFFTVLQSWFQLLDVGLSSTISRETAQCRGGAIAGATLAAILRKFERIFVGMALLGAVVVAWSAEMVAKNWLRAEVLTVRELRISICIIGFTVAARWLCGLYRGVLHGSEKMVILNLLGISFATARFVVVIPLILVFGSQPLVFFGYQAAVAIAEVACLMTLAWRGVRALPGADQDAVEIPFPRLLKFSLTVAITSSAWVVIGQTDKLVLSKILALADYGYFSATTLVASGIIIASTPVSAALLPRLTRLAAESRWDEVIGLYRDCTQLIAAMIVPMGLMLAVFPKQVLWVWSGNIELVNRAYPVLTPYALGNVMGALGSFAYYLQYAYGDLKLHLAGSVIFLALLVPTMLWIAHRFGPTGAGWVWMTMNTCYLVLWVPLVQRRFKKGLSFQWVFRDIVWVAVFPLAGALLALLLIKWPEGRAATGAILGGVTILLWLLGVPTTRVFQRMIFNFRSSL